MTSHFLYLWISVSSAGMIFLSLQHLSDIFYGLSPDNEVRKIFLKGKILFYDFFLNFSICRTKKNHWLFYPVHLHIPFSYLIGGRGIRGTKGIIKMRSIAKGVRAWFYSPLLSSIVSLLANMMLAPPPHNAVYTFLYTQLSQVLTMKISFSGTFIATFVISASKYIDVRGFKNVGGMRFRNITPALTSQKQCNLQIHSHFSTQTENLLFSHCAMI